MPIHAKTSRNQSNTVPRLGQGHDLGDDRCAWRVSRSVFRCLTGSSLLVVACVIGFHPTATAQSLGPLVQITGSDPFSDCTADHVNSQKAAYGSTLYPNTS